MSSPELVWRALADPTRRQILDLLAARARSTGEICAHFEAPGDGGQGLGRTGVMKHLDVLAGAGLLVVQREGRTRWNHLNPVPVQAVCDRWVRRHVRGLSRSLTRLQRLAEGGEAAEGDLMAIERLEGRRLVLERVDPSRDAVDLFRCSHGSRRKAGVWTHLPYGPFADDREMGTWLAGCAAATATNFLTVRDRQSDRALGMVSYQAFDAAHRRVELAHIWNGVDTQRTGTNTEAVWILLREAFRRGMRRIEWKCNVRNQRSRAAALRLGFAFEGTFRQHMLVKGRNRDTAWFAMIDKQWPAARRALERWLALPATERPSLASLRR